MDILTFTLEGKPVPKARARLSRGRAFTPKQTREYEAAVAEAGRLAMSGRSPVAGAVTLSVKAFFPIPQSWPQKRKEMARAGSLAHTSRPDGTNVLKSIEDGLNGVAYADDSQIVTSHIEKYYSDIPRIQVTVSANRKETGKSWQGLKKGNREIRLAGRN